MSLCDCNSTIDKFLGRSATVGGAGSGLAAVVAPEWDSPAGDWRWGGDGLGLVNNGWSWRGDGLGFTTKERGWVGDCSGFTGGGLVPTSGWIGICRRGIDPGLGVVWVWQTGPTGRDNGLADWHPLAHPLEEKRCGRGRG